MKKLSYLLFLILLFPAKQYSQGTLLWGENFNGATPNLVLNTTAANSTAGSFNRWIVNSNYTPSAVGIDFTCWNQTTPFATFPYGNAVPSQPAGITASPNSTYLHVTTADGINTVPPVTDAHYLSSDNSTSGCMSEIRIFANMGFDVSTVTQSNVYLKFWWLNNGAAAIATGELYYSTNAGTTWTLIPSTTGYHSQATWVRDSINLPAFAFQNTLRFGFVFDVNDDPVNGAYQFVDQPGFCVDDVQLYAGPQTTFITTDSVSRYQICNGDSFHVYYTAGGTYLAGNAFTAELSSASGSFATPTVIGAISSTTSGMITCTNPGATTAGTGYRIRVKSGTPNITGTDNGINIQTYRASNGGNLSITPDSVCPGGSVELSLNQSFGTIAWQSSTDGTTFTSISGSGALITEYPVTSPTYYRALATNAICAADPSDVEMVILKPAPTAGFTYVFSPPFDVAFSNTTTGAVSYAWTFGDGNSSSASGPLHTYSANGHYEVILIATGASGCQDTIMDSVQVGTVANEYLENDYLNVYPNPNTGEFQVVLPSGFSNSVIRIYNSAGQLVLQRENVQGLDEKISISLSAFAKGIYQLNLTDNVKTYQTKILVH